MRINETGAWDDIPGLSLVIVLPEPASIRVLYSMSVMPDQNFGNHGKILSAHLTSPWTAAYFLIVTSCRVEVLSHVVRTVWANWRCSPRYFRYRFAASQPAEDVSARLVVDGVPYRESIGSYALLSRHVSSGMLERDLVLNLQVRTSMQTASAPAL